MFTVLFKFNINRNVNKINTEKYAHKCVILHKTEFENQGSHSAV